MSDIVIKIDNLGKQYRLGQIGTGTIAHDLNRWWATTVRGKEDPYLKIGETNRQGTVGTSEYVWALKDVNLEVKQGEILGIIGKNGAGKSTLLKILSRVTKPTIGTISYKGRIASLLEVGTGFHPEMTGRENIFMNGSIMGMNKAEITRKLDEIVDFAGLERYIDTPTKRYSSGMTVRLGFAIAAHLEPEILVVDEVLAVGDAEFQKKAIGKMQDISKGEGRTVLFVSHNMASIQALCNKAIILRNGTIWKAGDVYNVVNSYIAEGSGEFVKSYKKTGPPEHLIAWIDESCITINKKETDYLLCGQDTEIVIKYKSTEENLKASLFLGIYNSHDEKILHLGMLYSDKETFNTKKEGTITCRINKMPLMPGRYSVNLSLIINGLPHERIQNAYTFIVENGDFYGNGKLPIIKENKFLIEQNWKIIQ